MQKIWDLIEKTVCFTLKNVFKILHRELTENQTQTFLQFVKFCIVGVTNTIIAYVSYLIALKALNTLGVPTPIDYLVAHVFDFIISVLWSYYWNSKTVFVLQKNETRSEWKSLVKTFISYSLTGLFLNSALLVLWVQILQISKYIAPLINFAISVPLNFVMNKLWAFKSEKK